MNSELKKEKTIGLKLILGWIIGVLFLFLGVMNLFKYPVVGVFEILAALVVFPPFMQFVKSKFGLSLSGILRFVIFIILMGIGIGWSLKMDKPENSNVAQTGTGINQPTPQPSPIVLEASVFIDEYDKNKIGAQEKFTGKRIQFSAFIENISSNVVGKYYLSLNPTNNQYYFGTTIQCYFADKAALLNLSNGQSITLAGTAKDMSFGNIELDDCSVIK